MPLNPNSIPHVYVVYPDDGNSVAYPDYKSALEHFRSVCGYVPSGDQIKAFPLFGEPKIETTTKQKAIETITSHRHDVLRRVEVNPEGYWVPWNVVSRIIGSM